MYYGDLELELDAIEANGGGRVTQEMAKNPALGGVMPTFPEGIPAAVVAHRTKKTLIGVGARRTQVLRTKEGE